MMFVAVEKNVCCLSQWPTFKLFGITYLVGQIYFKLLFHGPLAEQVVYFLESHGKLTDGSPTNHPTHKKQSSHLNQSSMTLGSKPEFSRVVCWI